MLMHHKRLCKPCGTLCSWLTGLTFLAVGVIGLLQQLNVFEVSPWGWTWPILVLVWGLVFLFNVGCKDCADGKESCDREGKGGSSCCG